MKREAHNCSETSPNLLWPTRVSYSVYLRIYTGGLEKAKPHGQREDILNLCFHLDHFCKAESPRTLALARCPRPSCHLFQGPTPHRESPSAPSEEIHRLRRLERQAQMGGPELPSGRPPGWPFLPISLRFRKNLLWLPFPCWGLGGASFVCRNARLPGTWSNSKACSLTSAAVKIMGFNCIYRLVEHW